MEMFESQYRYWVRVIEGVMPLVPRQIIELAGGAHPIHYSRTLFRSMNTPSHTQNFGNIFYMTAADIDGLVVDIAFEVNRDIYRDSPEFLEQINCAARAIFLSAVYAQAGNPTLLTGYHPRKFPKRHGHVWVRASTPNGTFDLDPSKATGVPDRQDQERRRKNGFLGPEKYRNGMEVKLPNSPKVEIALEVSPGYYIA